MSTASDLLDAILAESEDEAVPGQYSIDDALNDQSDFTLDSLERGREVAQQASTSQTGATQSISSNGDYISAQESQHSLENGVNGLENPNSVHISTLDPTERREVVSPTTLASPSPSNPESATGSSSKPKTPPVKLTIEDVMSATDDLEQLGLGTTSNVNMDHLVKSIVADRNEGVEDVQLMKKVKEYERSLMDVEDSKRLLKTLEERRRKRELNSSILQIVKLDKIGAQITSQQFKKTSGSGTPTCIAASAKLLAIGTSHGLTLIFDHFQQLKLVIGASEGVEYGRVYSVAFSPDSEWLIVGHHLGKVVIWDLIASKPVKTLSNDAPLLLDSRGTVPIIFVDFVEGKKNKIIVLSLDGVLNIHSLTRVFLVTMTDTQYILTGSSGAGSVIAVAPLQPGVGKVHPVDAHNLIACATFKRVVVFPSSDKNTIIYHLKRPDNAREGALPYLAWRELVSTSKNGQTKLLDPVLAVGWGTTIILTQIVQSTTDAKGIPIDPSEVGSLLFRRVATFQSDSEITSVHWMGTGVLVYTNTADELRVLDPFSVEEIEIDHVKQMELAYHTKFTGLRAALPGTPEFAPSSISSPQQSISRHSSNFGASGQGVRGLGPGGSGNASQSSNSSSSGSSPSYSPPVPKKTGTKALPIPKDILEAEKLQTAKMRNNSPALSNRDQMMSQSYHATICCFRGKLFLMGMKSPFTAVVLGWSERIAAIVEKGKWLDALALSLDFYHGRGKAVKGLPRDPVRAAAKIGARIEQLLYDYARVNLAIPVPKDPTHFEMVATVCIDYCLILGRVDILFQLLYPLFQNRKKAGLLLEKLEPFILGDQLTSLPPEIIQQLVRHYVSHPHLIPKLEQLLLHIDLALLDFHSVVHLCIKHHLSTALFHLYIDGLQDFITPMDHLMKVLVKDLDLTNQFTTPEMKELKSAIGYKIILYLSYIFKGKSFPSEARLSPRKVEELREIIFDYLFIPKLGGDLAGERYPRLRVLLATDSHELLAVLRIALDGISSPKRLIQVTDILVSVMVDPAQSAGRQHSLFWTDKSNDAWPFAPSQVADLYHFIAHYYSGGAVDISDDLLLRITGYTLLSADPKTADKRERLLLEILRSCPEQKLDYQKLALLAESAKFYKVCDFFFTHRRDYGAVIRCHILDPEYRKSIFSFVRTLMTSTDPSNTKISSRVGISSLGVADVSSSSSSSSSSAAAAAAAAAAVDPRFVSYMLTDKEKDDVKRCCIEKINDLIRIDNERTAHLVINVLKCEQSQIMALLNPHPEIQLAYLKACLIVATTSDAPSENASSLVDGTPTKRKRSSRVHESMTGGIPSSHINPNKPPLDLVAGEKLLELLCRFEPGVVASWLKENESVYRLDAAIEITKYYKIWSAYCALQETAGDMSEVLRIMMEPVSITLDALYEVTKNTQAKQPFGTSGSLPTQEREDEVQELLDIAVSFCKRNHKRMEASESQQMWFRILDQLMFPLGEVEALLSGSKTSAKAGSSGSSPSRFAGRPTIELELLKYHLNKLMSRILDSMIGYVDLQAILEKILNDRVDSKVADFRDIFVRLLENYTHERNILGAAVKVLRYDTHQQFSQLVRRKQRGVAGRFIEVQNTSTAATPSEPKSYELPEETSRLQLLRDIDSGAIRKTTNATDPNHMRRDTLASMRNVQLQTPVAGAMPSYSLFHSVIRLDDTPPK